MNTNQTICEICKQEVKSTKALAIHINNKHPETNKEEYFIQFLSINNEHICSHCGNRNTFKGFAKRFTTYCSQKCIHQSEKSKSKRKSTIKTKYGVNNVSQLDSVKEKKIETCIKNNGVEYALQSKEIFDKLKNTMKERHGVENAMHSEIFLKKQKETYDENFVQNIENGNILKQKRKETMKSRYGVEYYSQTDKFKEQIQNTCMTRYGVSHQMKLQSVKQKIENTNLIRFGFKNAFQNKDVQNKAYNTNLKLYGHKYVIASKSIRSKIEKTNIKQFGSKNIFSSTEFLEKFKNFNFYRMYDKLLNSDRLQQKVKPLFEYEEYNGVDSKYKYKFECLQCNNIFEDNLDDGRVPRCIICYPYINGTSKYETELYEYLLNILPENTIIKRNDRTVITPLELDIYIPEYKLAIEFNGLYWHTEERGKDKSYHINKTNLCKERGIQLIHIFEDEWIYKTEIVKSIIMNKLGLNKNKIYAHNCTIKLVDEEIAFNFLDNNHIHGYVDGYHIGLYFNNELVSILTISESRNEIEYDWEILRFCGKLYMNVSGSFNKLLEHFTKEHLNETIVTYCDLRYGYGSIYLNNGFKFLNTTEPNYYNNLNMLDENSIIWDCGYNKFVRG